MIFDETYKTADLILRAGEAPRHLEERFSAEDLREFEKLAKCMAVRRAAGGGHRGGVARAALAHGGGRCGWPAEVRPTAQIRRTAGSRQPADHIECLTTALRRRTD